MDVIFLINFVKGEVEMKKIMRNMASVVASLALLVTTVATNNVCLIWMHQPELPEGADSLRRK